MHPSFSGDGTGEDSNAAGIAMAAGPTYAERLYRGHKEQHRLRAKRCDLLPRQYGTLRGSPLVADDRAVESC